MGARHVSFGVSPIWRDYITPTTPRSATATGSGTHGVVANRMDVYGNFDWGTNWQWSELKFGNGREWLPVSFCAHIYVLNTHGTSMVAIFAYPCGGGIVTTELLQIIALQPLNTHFTFWLSIIPTAITFIWMPYIRTQCLVGGQGDTLTTPSSIRDTSKPKSCTSKHTQNVFFDNRRFPDESDEYDDSSTTLTVE